ELGPYRIEAFLGRGGMGSVYRARDTRLDRFVAIKVSNEQLGDRFGREARTIAALNHPHICRLYDVGTNYLVMELLEGETLAARIKRGMLPLNAALKNAIEIAGAIDYAHRARVVHRDIKPNNIMLTKDGVKVLDFGLAKMVAQAPPGSDAGAKTATLTLAGAILGTAPYMSPEQ